MSFVSERAKKAIADGGGRHYRGAGLGKLKAWKCPGCGAENAGPLTAGCIACGAGAPGTQVRKPGETVPDGGKVAERQRTAPAPPAPAPVARAPLRIPKPAASAVDYDEIERRVARALEQRLGGGYTEVERATIYLALTVYIGAWEDGMIEPTEGLTLEKCRELAARVGPDEMPPIEAGEAERHGTTETTTASGDAGAPEYDDLTDGESGGGEDGGDTGAAETGRKPGAAGAPGGSAGSAVGRLRQPG